MLAAIAAAVPAGQGDRQQAELPGRLQARPARWRCAVGRDAQGDVGGLGQEADLVGEDRVHAVPLGDPGHRGHVGGQRDGRQRALADDHRVDELHRDVLRVGARPAGAEHHQLAAAVEPHRHGVAGRGDRAGLAGQVARGLAAQLEQAAGRSAVGTAPRPAHKPWPV